MNVDEHSSFCNSNLKVDKSRQIALWMNSKFSGFWGVCGIVGGKSNSRLDMKWLRAVLRWTLQTRSEMRKFCQFVFHFIVIFSTYSQNKSMLVFKKCRLIPLWHAICGGKLSIRHTNNLWFSLSLFFGFTTRRKSFYKTHSYWTMNKRQKKATLPPFENNFPTNFSSKTPLLLVILSNCFPSTISSAKGNFFQFVPLVISHISVERSKIESENVFHG